MGNYSKPTFMKSLLLFVIICSVNAHVYSQNEYEPSPTNPYGLPNPNAPSEIQDYQDLIGLCDCKSTSRNPDGTWAAAVDMTWEFKYILNGLAVQDQTLKADGAHSGSIRQFIAKDSRWYVHYYASAKPSPKLGTWEGGKKGANIVLYKDQKAPNGTEGKFRITFHDISTDGFSWLGEWTSIDESIIYPTWKIQCKKRKM